MMTSEEAIAQLTQALQAYASEDLERAETLCRGVLDALPERPEALTLMGVLRRKAERYPESESYYQHAIRVAPYYADAHQNLGNLYKETGRLEEALACFEKSVALRSDWPEGLSRLAATYHALDRFPESFQYFERAIAVQPDYADGHWDYALALLAAGRYPDGWREYEWRWARRQPVPRDFTQPAWQGEDLRGKRLLVYVEQGYGDAIQFLRFLPLLKDRGAYILLEIHHILIPLVDPAMGMRTIVAAGAPLPEFDVHVALLSLPHILGITLDNLPATVPYLRVDKDRVMRFAPRIAAAEGLKVGLVWAGNPNVKNDTWRSPRLGPLVDLFKIPGVTFFALQKGDGRRDLEQYGPFASLVDLGDDLHDFGDTAAVMNQMDLILTTDTSVAHLAGALGRPTWVMLHRAADWRWLAARDDSPWYPTLKLYRQSRMGDWESVAHAIENDLRRRVGQPAVPRQTLQQAFESCPLCASRDERPLKHYDCRKHPLWHPPLPPVLSWRQCNACGHVHTSTYFTDQGLSELFQRSHTNQLAGGDYDAQRFTWSRVVDAVLKVLPGAPQALRNQARWLDVGCGNGALVFTAAEYGFAATGLDARREAVERLSALGYAAIEGDLLTVPLKGPYTVISLADVLEHIPDPRAALKRVQGLLADGGAVFISCPNMDCASWRALDAANANPYWVELEHLHNFSRARLMALLSECGFEPVSYGISQRYKACMEVIALKHG